MTGMTKKAIGLSDQASPYSKFMMAAIARVTPHPGHHKSNQLLGQKLHPVA